MCNVIDVRKIIFFLAQVLVLTTLCNPLHISAQAPTISRPVAPENIVRADGQSVTTVRVVFNAVCSGTIRFGLPSSVSYVPLAKGGGVTKTGGTASVSISEASLVDLNKPEFTVSGVVAVGDEITFTIARRADCGSLAVSKDTVYFISGAGCANTSDASGDTYSILSPAFSITPPPAINSAVLGTTTNRTTTITNGGLGGSDTVRFYIVYKDAAIQNTTGSNTITANSVNFTPWRVNGDTLFYKIFGAGIFGGDSVLSSGETVTIIEPIRVVKCGTATNGTVYNVSWGRTPDLPGCQNASGTSIVTMANGVDILSVTFTELTVLAPCSPGLMRFNFNNTGSGGNAGAMYNVRAIMGNSSPNGPNVIGSERPSAFVSENTTTAITYSDFKYNGSGSVLVTTASATAPWIMNASQFTSDPDGAGVGLEDLDGDGQYDDLAPGQSFSITAQNAYNILASCTTPRYYLTAAARLEYNQMCGAAVTPSTFAHSKIWQSLTNGISKAVPTMISGGTPFTIKLCAVGNLTTNTSYIPTDSFYLKLSLPAGVTYIPASGRFNGNSSDVVVATSGSDVYLSGKRSAISNNGFCFQGDFTYTCGIGSTLNIPYQIYWVLERSCGAVEYLSCDNITINAKCPISCASILNSPPTAIRLNYNKRFANPLNSEMASSATVPLLSTKTLLPYDTLSVIQPAKQGSLGATTLYYNYELNKAAGQNVVSFLNGTINFRRGATTVTYPMPAYSDLSTATLTRWEWNLTSILAASPLGGLLSGDSVWVDYKMNITTANNALLYAATLTAPPNQSSYFYSRDAATKEYCDSWAFDIYLLGLGTQGTTPLFPSTRSIIGCGNNQVGNNNPSALVLEPGDAFPGEYRPYTIVDSVKYLLPAGIVFDNYAQQTIDTVGATDFTYIRNLRDITSTSSYIGNTVTVKFPTNIFYDDLLPSSRTQANNTRIRVRATCEAGDNNFVEATSYSRIFAYANILTPLVQTIVGNTSTNLGLRVAYNSLNRPAISVINNTGIVQGVNVAQYWDVEIGNPSTQNAPNVWIALEKGLGSGNILVDSVKLLPALTTTLPIAGTYNGSDKWYQLSGSIASGVNQRARVYFRYGSCTKDSILLKAGWACVGFPSPNPSAYPCVASSSYLVVEPQPSQLQVGVNRHPGGGSSINLCEEDSVKILITSAQAANLVDPHLTFFPPSGVSMGRPILVEYPRASGNYQAVAPVSIAGGGYQINLNEHTGIGALGIIGTANANPAYSPLGADREAIVVIKYTPDCNFTSGSGLRFNVFGSRPCGQPAIGNGLTGLTNGANLTGASVPGSAGINITLSGAAAIGCGDILTINQSILPTSVASTAGDTIINTLGNGLGYAGGITPGFSAVVSGGGPTPVIVKVAMPAGFIAPGAPIEYSFNVTPQAGSCDITNITAQYQRDGALLSCSGTPCPTATRTIIASGVSPYIALAKPSLSLQKVELLGSSDWRQADWEANNVKVVYANSGSQAYIGGTDTVEFFCNATASTPFAKRPLLKNLPIGAVDSDTYSVMMPMGACMLGDAVTTRIQTTTASNTPQCLCNGSSITSFGVALPLHFLSTDINATDCSVTVYWRFSESMKVQLKMLEIERSTDGIQFSKLASLGAEDTTYTDKLSPSGISHYRLKVTFIDGVASYSKTLKSVSSGCDVKAAYVYPNPTQNKLNVDLKSKSGPHRYKLCDLLGRVLSEGILQGGEIHVLDLSSYTSDSYLLHLTDDNTNSVHQLTKSR